MINLANFPEPEARAQIEQEQKIMVCSFVLRSGTISLELHGILVRFTLQELVNGHPLIVRLFHAWEANDNKCFALEFVGGGDLFEILKKERKFSVHRAARYVLQLGKVRVRCDSRRSFVWLHVELICGFSTLLMLCIMPAFPNRSFDHDRIECIVVWSANHTLESELGARLPERERSDLSGFEAREHTPRRQNRSNQTGRLRPGQNRRPWADHIHCLWYCAIYGCVAGCLSLGLVSVCPLALVEH
jgi:hypothetical protein